MQSNESIKVQHQPEQQRFIIPLGEDLAILEYQLSADQVDFTHTWVPPEHRGGNHARLLVRDGLDWARSEQLNITASCWYVAKFLDSE